MLAGQIAPVLESLFLSRDDFRTVFHHVYAILHAKDLAVLVAFGWLLVPSARMVYERSFANNADAAATKRSKSLDKGGGEENEEIGGYEGSWFSFAVDSLSQMFRLAMLVYACDCVVSAALLLGISGVEQCSLNAPLCRVVFRVKGCGIQSLRLRSRVRFDFIGIREDHIRKVNRIQTRKECRSFRNRSITYSSYFSQYFTSWLTRRAQRFKRPLVRRMLPDAPENSDKINLINWIVDWILLSVLFIKVLEFLSVETG